MRILVTGGAGYIGSHTIKALMSAGHNEIIVIDDLSTGQRENIPSHLHFVVGDFSDPFVLKSAFQKDIDYVIHFAASKNAPESVINPGKYYDNNLSKSITLLNYCIKKRVKGLIFSSSAAVYGDVQEYPITEDFKVEPTNPYGWSKLMFERVLKDVSSAGSLRHVSLRYFNAAGADPECELGNNHLKGEDLISVIINSARDGRALKVFGNDYETKDGTCVRDLVHVSDLAAAHLAALDYLDSNGESVALNLGSEEGFTVKEIAEKAQIITGVGFPIEYVSRREGDIVVSIASSEKAKKVLGWSPKYSSLDSIIKTTWNWDQK